MLQSSSDLPLSSPLPTPQIRPSPLPATERSYDFIYICHPGYPSHPVFHSIAVYKAHGEPNGGCPIHVVLDAAFVLAYNQLGYLTDLDKTMRFHGNGLLPAGSYLYHVEDDPNYPLCPNFRTWKVPDHLPAQWTRAHLGMATNKDTFHYGNPNSSAYSEVIRNRDEHCLVSGDVSRMQMSYLVPRSENDWWIEEDMDSRLRTEKTGINQPSNVIVLRADLNARGFDQGHFIIFPVEESSVLVFMTSELADAAEQFHLQRVELPIRIHPLCLFARFAWNVFKISESRIKGLNVRHIPSRVLAQQTEDDKQATKRVRMDTSNEDTAQGSLSAASGTEAEDDPPDLTRPFSERDYEIWAAEERDAILNGTQDDDNYEGYTALMRLKNDFKPAPVASPVLPLSTFDVSSEGEKFIASPLVSDSASVAQSENSTVKAVECASLLSMTSPALGIDSPKLCTSLLEPSLPQPSGPPSGLGQRRGFKGAPLNTPGTMKRQSPSFLSSAKSPRTPLSAITNNLIRTPTAKSPLKSPKSPEPPIPHELQQIYSTEDPFAANSESFYSPDIRGAVLFSRLDQLDAYWNPKRNLKTRSTSKFWTTQVYDLMIYNYDPTAAQRSRYRPRGTRGTTKARSRKSSTLTPCVRLPTNEWRLREWDSVESLEFQDLGLEVTSAPDYSIDFAQAQIPVHLPPRRSSAMLRLVHLLDFDEQSSLAE
ncbi:hypothetical protein MKEN_01204900 [Mycena kentingensis (nom. inval.)]|nr:hypothetical protein MKEN_01204900 [Mycena kentingensis (nom. inval.)]